MKHFFILASVILLTITPPVFAQADEETQPTAEQDFREAYLLLSQADYARDNQHFTLSIDLYRRALDRYIELAQKYQDWQPGVVRFRLSYCDNQLKALLKNVEDGKIKLRPPGSDADTVVPPEGAASDGKSSVGDSIRKVKEFVAAGDVNHARNLLLETLRSHPDNIVVRMLIGVVQCEARKFDDAVFLLENLVEETHGNADAHVILGTAYFGLNRAADAIGQMKKALELDPSHKEAHFDLAQILLSVRPPDMEEARTHYRKALSLGAAGDPELDTMLGTSVDSEPQNDQ